MATASAQSLSDCVDQCDATTRGKKLFDCIYVCEMTFMLGAGNTQTTNADGGKVFIDANGGKVFINADGGKVFEPPA